MLGASLGTAPSSSPEVPTHSEPVACPHQTFGIDQYLPERLAGEEKCMPASAVRHSSDQVTEA